MSKVMRTLVVILGCVVVLSGLAWASDSDEKAAPSASEGKAIHAGQEDAGPVEGISGRGADMKSGEQAVESENEKEGPAGQGHTAEHEKR